MVADALSGHPQGWRQTVCELWGGAVPTTAQPTQGLETKQEAPPTGLEGSSQSWRLFFLQQRPEGTRNARGVLVLEDSLDKSVFFY